MFNQTEATYVNNPFNIVPYCSLYEFEHTLSTQEHAGVHVIIPGDIYISRLHIAKYIYSPVGKQQRL